MSDSGPSADSADGRSAAGSLTFARQMAAITENLVAAQEVLSETAACQSSLASDVIAMNATLGQLVGVVGNLATQHSNVAAQVGSLVTAVTITDNTVNTVAATSKNCLDATVPFLESATVRTRPVVHASGRCVARRGL